MNHFNAKITDQLCPQCHKELYKSYGAYICFYCDIPLNEIAVIYFNKGFKEGQASITNKVLSWGRDPECG